MLNDSSVTLASCLICAWTLLEYAVFILYTPRVYKVDGKSDTEIKRRIGIAKTVYKMEKLLTSRNVDLGTRIRLL